MFLGVSNDRWCFPAVTHRPGASEGEGRLDLFALPSAIRDSPAVIIGPHRPRRRLLGLLLALLYFALQIPPSQGACLLQAPDLPAVDNSSSEASPPRCVLNISAWRDEFERLTTLTGDSASDELLNALLSDSDLLSDPLTGGHPYVVNPAQLFRWLDHFGNMSASEELPWDDPKKFLEEIPVLDMFPLSNWDNKSVVLIALLYALLFLMGICGNVSVITLIRHVHASIPYDNTMIYILFLCCVDLASIVPLPMTIVDQLLGFWMFGTALCKVYRILEHVGRALSTFVLAAMACDRYLRVCYPHKRISRSHVVYTLVGLSIFTFLLLSPLLVRSSSEEIVLKEVLLENPYRLARVRIFKCMDHLDGPPLSIFIFYMFLLGFFIPVVLIFVFYGLMVRRLVHRSRTIPSSQLPVAKIAFYTIAISVFFVVCWSPYWIATLYNLYSTFDEDDETVHHTSSSFIYVMYGIHALPFFNSASNWLLYGLLNSQLMRRASEHKSHYMSRMEETKAAVPEEPLLQNGNTSLHHIHQQFGKGHGEVSSVLPRTSDSLL